MSSTVCDAFVPHAFLEKKCRECGQDEAAHVASPRSPLPVLLERRKSYEHVACSLYVPHLFIMDRCRNCGDKEASHEQSMGLIVGMSVEKYVPAQPANLSAPPATTAAKVVGSGKQIKQPAQAGEGHLPSPITVAQQKALPQEMDHRVDPLSTSTAQTKDDFAFQAEAESKFDSNSTEEIADCNALTTSPSWQTAPEHSKDIVPQPVPLQAASEVTEAIKLPEQSHDGEISTEAAWKQTRLEMKWEISLADFRALTTAEFKDVLEGVPPIIRGRLRRIYSGPEQSKPSKFAPELLRIQDSDLTLHTELGQGTFSIVYRGTWVRTLGAGKRGVKPQTVAVKVPKSIDFVADLSRELVVLANFPHQNLLQLYGVCESNPPKLVVECMKRDLATALEKKKLRTRYQKVRVLKDVSSALAHLHAHGVIHRDVKPSNILLGDDQTKLCDLGSCKDMLKSIQHMTTVGTIAYMAPEMRMGRPVGRAADVWSFGVVLFEVLVGQRPDVEPLVEMEQAGCLKVLRDMFSECLSNDHTQRPTMAEIERQLLDLLHQEVQDLENLRAELRTALAQDLNTYNSIWETNYAQQAEMNKLLAQVQQLDAKTFGAAVRQPGSPTDYAALSLLANQVSERMHIALRRVVESCNGRYIQAPPKSPTRVAQKVKEEYEDDFGRLVDFERATGLFKFAADCHHCLVALCSGTQWELVRVKDRLTKGLDSGYRDVLLNIRDPETGFVFELQLNFEKISEIKSQSHRFYELHRVTKVQA